VYVGKIEAGRLERHSVAARIAAGTAMTALALLVTIPWWIGFALWLTAAMLVGAIGAGVRSMTEGLLYAGDAVLGTESPKSEPLFSVVRRP
jgi:hypothetical protein